MILIMYCIIVQNEMVTQVSCNEVLGMIGGRKVCLVSFHYPAGMTHAWLGARPFSSTSFLLYERRILNLVSLEYGHFLHLYGGPTPPSSSSLLYKTSAGQFRLEGGFGGRENFLKIVLV